MIQWGGGGGGLKSENLSYGSILTPKGFVSSLGTFIFTAWISEIVELAAVGYYLLLGRRQDVHFASRFNRYSWLQEKDETQELWASIQAMRRKANLVGKDFYPIPMNCACPSPLSSPTNSSMS